VDALGFAAELSTPTPLIVVRTLRAGSAPLWPSPKWRTLVALFAVIFDACSACGVRLMTGELSSFSRPSNYSSRFMNLPGVMAVIAMGVP
jgi:phosphoglycerol transferase MdoB-like AlkP superfamily enzyme